MKKIYLLVAIIIALLISSCVVTKRQRENFLAKHCQRNDSISFVKKDSIVYKDSLIYIPKVVNTPIYLDSPCSLLCDSLGKLKNVNITTNKGGLKSTVKTLGNGLIFECETDSLKARISWLEHNLIISKNSHTENTIKIPCELDHRTKWDGFTWYWFIITASILGIWIIFNIFKSYLKL